MLQLIVVVVVIIVVIVIIIILLWLLLLLLLVFILLIVTIIIIVVVVIIIVIVKALKDLESLEATRKCLEEELGVTKSSLEQQGQVVAEQSTEMETLRRCLLQVTQDEISQGEGGVAREGGGGGGSSEDGEEGQVDGGGGNEEDEEEAKKVADKRKAQLVRIETLLNTTKVRCCGSRT